MKTEKYTIERFIFDIKLSNIAENNDIAALENYKKEFAGSEEIIDQAFLLMQNLKIKKVHVPKEQMEEDYQQIFRKIKKRRRIRTSLYISSLSAACACIAILFTTLFQSPISGDTKQQMFAMLDSLDKNTDEIQILSGSTKAYVANNDVIEQTEEGNVIVAGEEKVKSSEIQTEFIQLVVPNGKRTSIRFSDGTVAWVNSGSKLLYPKTFVGEKREIFIEGEIYLEVEKTKERPFIVHAKNFEVSVLGTKFNVNAYNEDNENSVVLIKGSVEVKTTNEKQKLVPNQGLFAKNGSVKIKEVDVYSYICWKDGIMKVNGETLGNMFTRLSRHYNIQILCDDPHIVRESYRGKLDLQESLEDVLYTLSLSTPFVLEKINQNTIRVYVPDGHVK